MYQQYKITYGTYDLGDSKSGIYHCANLKDAIEDAKYIAQNHFENLANRNRIRWKHCVCESIEECRDKIGYLTGARPTGAYYNGESLWTRGVSFHNGMIDDHIWYTVEPFNIKNPFEEL